MIVLPPYGSNSKMLLIAFDPEGGKTNTKEVFIIRSCYVKQRETAFGPILILYNRGLSCS